MSVFMRWFRFLMIRLHRCLWEIFISLQKLSMVNVLKFQTSLTKMHYMEIHVFDFFSVRSIFISPNEHQKQYFHTEYTTLGVNE